MHTANQHYIHAKARSSTLANTHFDGAALPAKSNVIELGLIKRGAVNPVTDGYGLLRQRLDNAMQRLDIALTLWERISSEDDKALAQSLVRAATREVNSAVQELQLVATIDLTDNKIANAV